MNSLQKNVVKDLIEKIGANSENAQEFAEAVVKLQLQCDDENMQKCIVCTAFDFAEAVGGKAFYDQFAAKHREVVQSL